MKPLGVRNLRADSVGTIFEDIGDFVGSIFKKVPGSEWVEGAVKTGAGFLADMAKDDTGRLILVGITNAFLFPAVAGIAIPSVSGMQTVGPQIASVVWAVPNLAAGDGFVEAYAAEITWRTEYLAQLFGLGGPAKTFLDNTRSTLGIPEVQSVSQQVWRNYGSTAPQPKPGELAVDVTVVDTSKISDAQLKATLKATGTDPATLAKKYGVREDAAAAAIMGLLKRPLWDLNADFNAESGTIRGATAAEAISRNSRTSFAAAKLMWGGSPPVGSVAVRPGPVDGPFSLHTAGILALITSPLWGPSVFKRAKKLVRF